MNQAWKDEAAQVEKNIAFIAKDAVHGDLKEAGEAAIVTGLEVVLDVVSGVTTGQPVNEEM